jgi:hypothetical protein
VHAFSLKDFEFKVDPEIWDAAQDLHTSGSVRTLREVEPKFWVAEVATTEYHVEVEILFAATKIKSFTCECRPKLARMRFCPHVAAALIKLRQFFEKERREREKPAPKPENTHSKLTIPNILAQADTAKLLEFLREYAQIDRDFNLALKTRFAAEMTGTADFFGQLLDSVIQPCRSSKLKDAEFRRLMTTLSDLEKQQSDATMHENFLPAAQLAATVVRKLLPLVPFIQQPRLAHLEKSMLFAVRRLSAIGLKNEIAPLLEEEISNFFFDILEKNAVLTVMENDFLDYYVEKTDSKEAFQPVAELIEKRAGDSTFVLRLSAVCFTKMNQSEKLLKILDFQTDFSEVLKVISVLSERSEWAMVKLICRHFSDEKINLDARSKLALQDFSYQTAQRTNDISGQTDYLRKRYLATGNLDYYQKIKIIAGKKWPMEFEKLLGGLRGQFQSDAVRYRIASILAEEGQTAVLAAYLESENDPELLERNVDYFLRVAPEQFNRLAKRLLADFLREHFGRQSAERVRNFLSNFRKKSPAITTEIIKTLLEEFWERPALVEEIGIFLTKDDRKALFERISEKEKPLDNGEN